MAISERKLKDGSTVYEIRVSRGRDPLTGKQLTPYSMRYTPPEGCSAKRAYKEAQVVAAQFEADCRAGKVLTKAEQKAQAEREQREAAAMPTFQAYTLTWLKEITPTRAANTLRAYGIVLERAGRLFNAYKLDEIKPYMIHQYLTDLQSSELSWNSCCLHYGTLKAFFQSAEDKELIATSPMAKVKRPRRPKDTTDAQPDVFTAEEAAYILDCMRQEPLKYQAMVAFMLDSGCRRGEVAGLMWNDIDFKAGKVTISRGVVYIPKQGIQVNSTKTGKSREFLIGPQTLALLKKWKVEQSTAFLKNGIPYSGYCFTDNTGKIINPEHITGWFSRMKKKYNIHNFHPHALRHSMISIAITSGVDVVTVSKRAGHANPSMTLNVYSHSNEKAQQRASEIIADAIYKKA